MHRITFKPTDTVPQIAPVLSKSESNRLLIIQALLHADLNMLKVSDANDTTLLLHLLQQKNGVFDVGDAGTVMRFLTAYLATKQGCHTITGNKRMQQRPIGALVLALNQLGAHIKYLGTDGFPPLQISGGKLGGTVAMDASISSQFVSALLMVAPYFNTPLQLTLKHNLVSAPYVQATIAIMRHFGVDVIHHKNTFCVPLKAYTNKPYLVEADWSAATYYYSMVALGMVSKITLTGYNQNSLQADSAVAHVFKQFGVHTHYHSNAIILSKTNINLPQTLTLNCLAFPDAVPAIAVTCAGLGIAVNLSGLQTLVIKETNRIEALKFNLQQLGLNVSATNNSLAISGNIKIQGASIKTFNDHRMAMAFATLAKTTLLHLDNLSCVAKSYPQFWQHAKQCGIFTTP